MAQVIGAGIVLIGAGGCQEVSPTAPRQAPTVVSVQIVPAGASAVPVRASVQLSAVEVLSDGSQRTSAATWAIDKHEVALVSATGLVTGVDFGTALVTATAGPHSATRILAIVPNCAGGFAGRFEVVGCRKTSGLGQDTCNVGVIRPISWSVTQVGDQLSGTLSLNDVPASGPVTGTVNQHAALSLAGVFRRAEDQAVITILEWSTQVDSACTTVTGRFSATREFVNIVGPQNYTEQYQLLDVTRQP